MATLTSSSAPRDTPGRVVPGALTWTPPDRPNKSWWTLIGLPVIVLAFRTLGYPIPEHGDGALIGALSAGNVPAKGQLDPGDVITAVDNVPAHLAPEAIGVLQKHKPGDPVALTVTKKDNTVTH